MRTTVYQERYKLIVKDRIIQIVRLQLSTGGMIVDDLTKELGRAAEKADSIELHINNKFILAVEKDEVNDETDGVIIERFDELRLNFGEVVGIKFVALTK